MKIWPSNKLNNDKDVNMSFEKKNGHRRYLKGKKIIEYFKTVEKRVEMANESFINQKLPYRLKVYIENKKVIIELLSVDKHGKFIRYAVRDITNENFGKLMDNLSTGTGLLFDDLPS